MNCTGKHNTLDKLFTCDSCKDLFDINKRLKYLKKQIKNENISYGEIAELQEYKDYIPDDEVELLEWAGIKENK